MTPRLSIRRKVYRDQEGFGISGRCCDSHYGVSVFVAGDDRAYAERVKARVYAHADQLFEPLTTNPAASAATDQEDA